MYDKACDSDALRKRLACRSIDLFCSQGKNCTKAPMQDRHKLRRYKRRWKVERGLPGWEIFAAWWCAGSSISLCAERSFM